VVSTTAQILWKASNIASVKCIWKTTRSAQLIHALLRWRKVFELVRLQIIVLRKFICIKKVASSLYDYNGGLADITGVQARQCSS
jgi:hypothetical protein